MTGLDPLTPLDWLSLKSQRLPHLFIGGMTVMMAERLRGGLVYLATPYTEQVKTGGEFDDYRSEVAGALAARWTLRLAVAGVTAVSPIALAVAMLREDRERALRPLDDDFWTAWCRPMLTACCAVAVPMVPGWNASRGVWAEVTVALRAQLPVVLIRDGEGME